MPTSMPSPCSMTTWHMPKHCDSRKSRKVNGLLKLKRLRCGGCRLRSRIWASRSKAPSPPMAVHFSKRRLPNLIPLWSSVIWQQASTSLPKQHHQSLGKRPPLNPSCLATPSTPGTSALALAAHPEEPLQPWQLVSCQWPMPVMAAALSVFPHRTVVCLG